jgi:hypothetical protein
MCNEDTPNMFHKAGDFYLEGGAVINCSTIKPFWKIRYLIHLDHEGEIKCPTASL